MALALVTLAGAALRTYGLDWGIPYHFHADEMLALRGAELLRNAPDTAAQSTRFFVYPVLPKRLLGVIVDLDARLHRPLDLNQPSDAGRLVILGRAVSAALSIAVIPLAFFTAQRLAGRGAGLLAATLVAGTVILIRNAHFFTNDTPLTFFCALTLFAVVLMVDDGRPRAYVLAAVALGAAISTKYTGAFLVLPLAVALWLAPGRPPRHAPQSAWGGWIARGALPFALAGVLFLAINPLVLKYPDKFRQDVSQEIIATNFSEAGPVWTAQFADVSVRPYWFTNLLPWGLGPAFALWGLAGVCWLLWRRDRPGLAVASYAIAYYAVASNTTTPFMRYTLPLVPALAVAAAVMSADLLARPGSRRWAVAGTAIVVAVTWLWALAYINVYRSEDVRLQAARFISQRIDPGAHILVEPSHNVPPMGSYFERPQFYMDYVGWGPDTKRDDTYVLHTLDVYEYLYDVSVPPDEKRRYIRDRLALADYIVLDDTFHEFYEHLHGPEHASVREYYRDLFAGRLDFRLMRAFHVRPSILGFEIHDETAEMTFTLFDHPDVFVFMRNPDADDPSK